MRTALVVVTYHTPKKEIERLKKETTILSPCSFIVVDNTKTNRGFAKAANNGIRKALKKHKPDVVLVLNPDIHFTRLSQAAFEKATGHFDVWGGVFTQQEKTYYGGVIDRWNMAGGLQITKPKKKYFKTDFVSGSCMAIKSTLFSDIGFLQERYFMYYEDTEFSFRAAKAGYKIGCTQAITYEHFEQSHTNPKKEFYLARNRRWFLQEYGTWLQKLHEFLAPR